MFLYKSRKSIQFRLFSSLIACAFALTIIVLPSYAQQISGVPAVGTMITTSQIYNPTVVAGITIHPENPLHFDFIIDSGDDNFKGERFEKESRKLINYFLATLTVPEDEMWVNLSPYEENRIIADGLSATEMGRDMLIQDYILKQFTASLMYPEEELGAEFWRKIYEKTQAKFGTTDIPANTFNKVWIVPDKASVYTNKNNVFVGSSHLKVMLEEDYLALESNIDNSKHGLGDMAKDDIDVISADAKEVIREIIIPEIEREINEGRNFANLRQIYNSMLLATWYKRNLHKNLLGKVYMDQNKVNGIDLDDKNIKEKIYKQYIEAFKVGVYDYIKEDYDPETQEVIERKYFSGGLTDFDEITTDKDASMLADDKFNGEVTSVSVELGLNRKPTAVLSGKPAGLKADAEKLLTSEFPDVEKLNQIAGELSAEDQIELSFVFDRNEFLESIDAPKDKQGRFIVEKQHYDGDIFSEILDKLPGFEALDMSDYTLKAGISLISTALENVVQHVEDGIALVVLEKRNGYRKIVIMDNGPGAIDGETGQQASIERIIKYNEKVGVNGNLGQGMHFFAESVTGVALIKQPDQWGLVFSMYGVRGETHVEAAYGEAEESRGFKIVKYLPESDKLTEEFDLKVLEAMNKVNRTTKNSIDLEKEIDAVLDSFGDPAMLGDNIEMLKKSAEDYLNAEEVNVEKLKAVAGMLSKESSIDAAFVFDRNKFLELIDNPKDDQGRFVIEKKRYTTDVFLKFLSRLPDFGVFDITDYTIRENISLISIALENVVQHIEDGVALVVVEKRNGYRKIEIMDSGIGAIDGETGQQAFIERIKKENEKVGVNSNAGEGLYFITERYKGLTLIKQPDQWGMILSYNHKAGAWNVREAYGIAEKHGGFKLIKYVPLSEEDAVAFNDAVLEVMRYVDGKELDSYDLESILDNALSEVHDMDSDNAMLNNPGGIDFNSQGLDIKVYGDDVNMRWGDNVDSFTINGDLKNMQPSSVEGITPVITNITPITNINMLFL